MGLQSRVSIGFLLLAVVSAIHAAPVWSNGQGARLIIGQPSPTRQDPVPSQTVLGAVGGISIAADRLFRCRRKPRGAVSISNRALIYETCPGLSPH